MQTRFNGRAQPKAKVRKRRRYNTRRIKQYRSYQIQEIAKLFRVHKNTVRQWIKRGLTVNDTVKPHLIYGEVLKEFLQRMQHDRKSKCKPGYLYCVKCRMPQKPLNMAVDIAPLNSRCLHLTAKCEVCDTAINQFASPRNLTKLQALFNAINT